MNQFNYLGANSGSYRNRVQFNVVLKQSMFDLSGDPRSLDAVKFHIRFGLMIDSLRFTRSLSPSDHHPDAQLLNSFQKSCLTNSSVHGGSPHSRQESQPAIHEYWRVLHFQSFKISIYSERISAGLTNARNKFIRQSYWRPIATKKHGQSQA